MLHFQSVCSLYVFFTLSLAHSLTVNLMFIYYAQPNEKRKAKMKQESTM